MLSPKISNNHAIVNKESVIMLSNMREPLQFTYDMLSFDSKALLMQLIDDSNRKINKCNSLILVKYHMERIMEFFNNKDIHTFHFNTSYDSHDIDNYYKFIVDLYKILQEKSNTNPIETQGIYKIKNHMKILIHLLFPSIDEHYNNLYYNINPYYMIFQNRYIYNKNLKFDLTFKEFKNKIDFLIDTKIQNHIDTNMEEYLQNGYVETNNKKKNFDWIYYYELSKYDNDAKVKYLLEYNNQIKFITY